MSPFFYFFGRLRFFVVVVRAACVVRLCVAVLTPKRGGVGGHAYARAKAPACPNHLVVDVCVLCLYRRYPRQSSALQRDANGCWASLGCRQAATQYIVCVRVFLFSCFFFLGLFPVTPTLQKTTQEQKQNRQKHLQSPPSPSLTPHYVRRKKKTKQPHSLGRKTRRATFLTDILIPSISDNPSSFAHAPPAT